MELLKKSVNYDSAERRAVAQSIEDPRIKLVEFVTTLGGLLGIVTSLLQDLLLPQAKSSLAVLFVLFILFCLLAYAALAVHLPQSRIEVFLGGQSATFSGLIVVAFSIPLSNASVGIAIQSISYVGVWGAVLIYLAVLVVLSVTIYWAITRAMKRIYARMAPA